MKTNKDIVYDTSFQATDACIINTKDKTLLLGKKPQQTKWRFLGGFVDVKDESLETANRREIYEEAGVNLEITFPEYLFSFRVDDPRYRESRHKIMSAVFCSEYLFGYAEAGDDIGFVQWVNIKDLKKDYPDILMVEHHPIIRGLVERGII